jgi:hypothetical protein
VGILSHNISGLSPKTVPDTILKFILYIYILNFPLMKALIWIASTCLFGLAIAFVSAFIWFKHGTLRIKDMEEMDLEDKVAYWEIRSHSFLSSSWINDIFTLLTGPLMQHRYILFRTFSDKYLVVHLQKNGCVTLSAHATQEGARAAAASGKSKRANKLEMTNVSRPEKDLSVREVLDWIKSQNTSFSFTCRNCHSFCDDFVRWRTDSITL